MKRNLYILGLVAIILLIFNCFLLFKSRDSKTSNEYSIKKIKEFYENKFILEKENESLQLDASSQFLTVEGDTVFAKDVFNKRTIVLKYSISNCESCIEAEYENLSKYASKTKKQICIITYNHNFKAIRRDYRILSSLGVNNIPIYLLLKDELGIPMDSQNIPFYFQVDSSLILSNFFIPESAKPDLSYYYLNSTIKNQSKLKEPLI